jgi:hypothetical protein
MMGKYTGLLYTTPSFLEGVGRIVDFGGALDMYNQSETPEEADTDAIASDWWAIGDDVRGEVSDAVEEHGIEVRDGE